jgi:hypothetical protein
MIGAALHGRRGERYIAGGRHVTMAEIFAKLEQIAHVKSPKRRLPLAVVFAVGALNEVRARLSGRPALVSLETARLIALDRDRTRFDHRKITQELGVTFRPMEETLRDVLAWYHAHGWLNDAPALDVSLKSA